MAAKRDSTFRIAKTLYTEHRGKVVGNTRAWDDLSWHEKQNLVHATGDMLELMEETWTKPRANQKT